MAKSKQGYKWEGGVLTPRTTGVVDPNGHTPFIRKSTVTPPGIASSLKAMKKKK